LNNKNNIVNKRVALLVATLASFLTSFMGSSVNIALSSIGNEFLLDAVLLNWVATSYLLAAAMFLVLLEDSRYKGEEEDFFLRNSDLYPFVFSFCNFDIRYHTYFF